MPLLLAAMHLLLVISDAFFLMAQLDGPWFSSGPCHQQQEQLPHGVMLLCMFCRSNLGARKLLGAPGLATSNNKLLGAPGLTARNTVRY